MGRRKKVKPEAEAVQDSLGSPVEPEELQAATPLAEEAQPAAEAVIAPAPEVPSKKTYEVVADKTITIGLQVTKLRKGKHIICHEDDPYLIDLLRQRVILREVT